MIAVMNRAPMLITVPRWSESKETVYEDIGEYPGLGGSTEKYRFRESFRDTANPNKSLEASLSPNSPLTDLVSRSFNDKQMGWGA